MVVRGSGDHRSLRRAAKPVTTGSVTPRPSPLGTASAKRRSPKRGPAWSFAPWRTRRLDEASAALLHSALSPPSIHRPRCRAPARPAVSRPRRAGLPPTRWRANPCRSARRAASTCSVTSPMPTSPWSWCWRALATAHPSTARPRGFRCWVTRPWRRVLGPAALARTLDDSPSGVGNTAHAHRLLRHPPRGKSHTLVEALDLLPSYATVDKSPISSWRKGTSSPHPSVEDFEPSSPAPSTTWVTPTPGPMCCSTAAPWTSSATCKPMTTPSPSTWIHGCPACAPPPVVGFDCVGGHQNSQTGLRSPPRKTKTCASPWTSS